MSAIFAPVSRSTVLVLALVAVVACSSDRSQPGSFGNTGGLFASSDIAFADRGSADTAKGDGSGSTQGALDGQGGTVDVSGSGASKDGSTMDSSLNVFDAGAATDAKTELSDTLQDATSADAGKKDAGKKDTGKKDTGKLPDLPGPPKIDIKTLKPGECINNLDCKVGVCVAGKCCADKNKVCGAVCCGATSVCFAGACVKPGKPCVAPEDCAPDGYCETALGGGKKLGGKGPMCVAPAALMGRCLKLPVKCPPKGSGKPAPKGCLPACEVKPPPGKLDPVLEWTWGPKAKIAGNKTDVWSTPTVARIHDSNCDGKIDSLDPPVVVVVTGDSKTTCCSCGGGSKCRTGVLRALDGATGTEIWSATSPFPGALGYAGLSVALGDVDGDKRTDIVTAAGKGRIVAVSGKGKVIATSKLAVSGATTGSFGWGGGLAMADMNGDGHPEVAYGNSVFGFTGTGAMTKVARKWVGKGGTGGGSGRALSTFANVDNNPNGHLELIGGNTAYDSNGNIVWKAVGVPDGFPAVADLDKNGTAEVVVIGSGRVYVIDGPTGKVKVAGFKLAGTGSGGPPTIADFDGDGLPEIGAAQRNLYSMVDVAGGKLSIAWKAKNHDLSSSVTGSTVFDFEGDGKAEVIYMDECYLWVYDGSTGKVRYSANSSSFTATEAPIVADVDGDGQAEIVLISNGARMDSGGWKCNVSPYNKGMSGWPKWSPPSYGPAWRGVRVFGSKSGRWVGTRTLWSQHTYHVTDICDPHDSACTKTAAYGTVPVNEKKNWTLKWLNNFRQNVQDKGIYDAPDATVDVQVLCDKPLKLRALARNLGQARLPKGVKVGFFEVAAGGDKLLGTAVTQHPLWPGQVVALQFKTKVLDQTGNTAFRAKILLDKQNPTFFECREDNNTSPPRKAACSTGVFHRPPDWKW